MPGRGHTVRIRDPGSLEYLLSIFLFSDDLGLLGQNLSGFGVPENPRFCQIVIGLARISVLCTYLKHPLRLAFYGPLGVSIRK